MSRRSMTKQIKTWSLVKVLTRSWSLENNTRKYQKCVGVTEINDVVSFFFFFFFFFQCTHCLYFFRQLAQFYLEKGYFHLLLVSVKEYQSSWKPVIWKIFYCIERSLLSHWDLVTRTCTWISPQFWEMFVFLLFQWLNLFAPNTHFL